MTTMPSKNIQNLKYGQNYIYISQVMLNYERTACSNCLNITLTSLLGAFTSHFLRCSAVGAATNTSSSGTPRILSISLLFRSLPPIFLALIFTIFIQREHFLQFRPAGDHCCWKRSNSVVNVAFVVIIFSTHRSNRIQVSTIRKDASPP